MSKENNLALVNKEDLSLVSENSLNAKQLDTLLKRTPAKYVKKRPAKGGGEWEYVTGGYVKKCLNLMFGWDWDFEILDQMVMHGEVVVKGRLTCRTNGRTIIKTQFGNKDIMYKRQPVVDENGKKVFDDRGRIKTEPSSEPLSIGNDMKAAATDALKKCAAEIGIAADIYNKEDFREVRVQTEEVSLEALKTLLKEVDETKYNPDELLNIERIIEQEESKSYSKAIHFLKTQAQ